MLIGDFSHKDPSKDAVIELQERVHAAEALAQTLLGVVAGLVATTPPHYPKTQKGWASQLLPLIQKSGVRIDQTLLQHLEQMRDSR